MSKMKLSQLALVVTDDCNFNCSYCLQTKEKSDMKSSTIEKAVTFFYPFLKEEASIIFYGGEPLLVFDNIKYAVSLLLKRNRKKGKKLKFYLTTNGSLITDEMLAFFHRHRFSITLSFDGLAQDIGRKPGSLVLLRELIGRIQTAAYRDIEFSIISVFTPGTVNQLCASLRYIIECNVIDLHFTLARDKHWDDASLVLLEKELARLTDFLVSYYKKKEIIPVDNFHGSKHPTGSKKKDSCFTCDAGFHRMAITPKELVWGCYVFHDYLKNREESSDFSTYCFGKLDDYIRNHESLYPQILANYTTLRQDCFFTEQGFCLFCEKVDICGICPVNAAYTTSFIGKISPWVCRLEGIQRKERKRFLEKIARL